MGRRPVQDFVNGLRKDAALLARLEDPSLRRAWRQRLVDHDGERDGEGGLARWLTLTDAIGLDRGGASARQLALCSADCA